MTDLRFAFRTLRNNPGFTCAAVLALGLGIGANSAMFSVVDGVLLRPLPFPRSDRLVNVWESEPKRNLPKFVAAPANYYDWRASEPGVFGAWRFYAEHVQSRFHGRGAGALSGRDHGPRKSAFGWRWLSPVLRSERREACC
jgi:hypothetical protein